MTTITIDHAVVEQALEACEQRLPLVGQATIINELNALRAALAQEKAEPLNLSDPGVQKRLAAQWGYVPAEQAEPSQEPVVRGAAYADALRSAIKACGAVQRDDGVWFGDDAAAKLARVLSEGIAPPRRTMVPLTEGEIDRIHLHLSSTVGSSYKTVARAIEKASWEKNHEQA